MGSMRRVLSFNGEDMARLVEKVPFMAPGEHFDESEKLEYQWPSYISSRHLKHISFAYFLPKASAKSRF